MERKGTDFFEINKKYYFFFCVSKIKIAIHVRFFVFLQHVQQKLDHKTDTRHHCGRTPYESVGG